MPNRVARALIFPWCILAARAHDASSTGHMTTVDAPSSPRIRAAFSDLDGTLVHFSQWFEEHGVRLAQEVTDDNPTFAIVEDSAGERRECRVLPKSTMGLGYVSERTVQLVDSFRAKGALFIVITAARKSTLLERLELLPACDVAVGECGTRIYYKGELDTAWAARFEDVSGPLETDLPPEERTQPLWQLCQRMVAAGLSVDLRSYYGCFRVDVRGSKEHKDLVEGFRSSMDPRIDCSMNLGKYDFYPAMCGKGNAVRYLQEKFKLDPSECAALFDDDNDLPMARECGVRLLPALTSDSIVDAVSKNPTWRVAKRCGQGVFAIEELLEFLVAHSASAGDDIAGAVPRVPAKPSTAAAAPRSEPLAAVTR